ncbi:DUF551 domain-containing protein [Acinetobacter sp. YH12090]|uniref:DUF551 domain-containing protein n=1 Tax=Acinetobacter sp. YH12090 TaxID=2601081 RepID=UPI0015D2915C|nr:DUF551 domain-containing protein [Acinetobacter sp. YH12090]
MDILEEIDVFLSVCQLTQDESNNLVFNGITGCFESKYLADWFVNQINFGWKLWQAAKAQAVQGWINVDDKLPPVDETVLVCWDYAPDIEPEKEYTTIDENLDEYWPNCQDEPPTHWMPLPKVVKAQEPAND